MTDDAHAGREAERLAALRQYAIVDTPPEAIFDGIARVAARICDTPMAMVTFIDQEHQSIKARVGVAFDSIRRDKSFCTHTIDQPTPMVVEDSSLDVRFQDLPLVSESPGIRFYAGAPIRTETGFGLGAVCVLDTKPRQLLPCQVAALEALADDVSARLVARKATVALAESERLHRELFAANPQPMWLVDAETWRFIDVNDAAVVAYGWSREEFQAMTARDLWLPEDRAVKENRFATGLPRHMSATITRHRRRDGSTIVIEAVAHEFIVSGRRAMLAIITDVSEREAAAGAILDANTKFAVAQRLAQLGSWEADLESGELTASDELHRLLGIPAGSMTHATQLLAFIHPEDRQHAFAARTATETSGVPMDMEHRVIRADGETRWVQCQVHVQFAADAQERHRFVGTMQDITARREAEARLREQAALIDSARDAIVVWDLDQVILSWNGGAERIFGWTAADAIGKDGVALLHRDPEALTHAMKQLMETGHWSGEMRKVTRGGEEVIVDGSWTLLRHENGTPKSVLVISTDVTERRKLEMQYLRAQRMESIGTLAGGIAHDLNNMLAPILMSIELLRTTVGDPDSAELLDTIRESAQRGADLVRQVLTFARGVEGEREDLTVTHILSSLAKFCRDTFPRAIEIVSEAESDLWWVLGDRTQLHQVLLNLAVNARDAMPTGGRLALTASNTALDAQYAAMMPDARAGNYVVLQVSDTGEGIPPAVRDRIFEPFFTTKGIGEGTGLGLATVQAIVRSHGGFVTVYSEPGKGTTFKVYLPAIEELRTTDRQEPRELLPRGHGETILVVDDEAAIRDISRQTLEAFGYVVLTATDGADALAIYARQGSSIDAIITDVMMPIMDGPAFIQAVRRLDPAVPIIAASGLSANRTGPMYGIRHFLAKPYTADTMLRALREVLGEE